MNKYSTNPEHKTHIEVLDEICSCGDKPCILKELILRVSGINDRMLEQFKCIEKFKGEESERQGRTIDWNQAEIDWIKEGYAKRFAEFYKEGITNGELYNLVMEKDEKQVGVGKS